MSDLPDQIDALLALNAKGAVSHPVPGLAAELLAKAATALRSTAAGLSVKPLEWKGGEWQGRLLDLVGEYFDLVYAEGVAQRDTDTMAGDAQRVLSGIQSAMGDAASLISSQKQEIERLTTGRDEADNRLVDKYRDPKAGHFSFPGDVAAIVRRLEAAESRVLSLEARLSTASALLVHLQHWIEEECGAEMPFDEGQAAAFAALKVNGNG